MTDSLGRTIPPFEDLVEIYFDQVSNELVIQCNACGPPTELDRFFGSTSIEQIVNVMTAHYEGEKGEEVHDNDKGETLDEAVEDFVNQEELKDAIQGLRSEFIDKLEGLQRDIEDLRN